MQVDIKKANISDNLNCGNISSAIGPFAIDEGLVPAVEPVTVVRIYNVNTNKIIESHVRVEDGHAAVYGDARIKGVPGTGSPIDLYFEKPCGAATGKTFPTGQKSEIFDVPDFGPVEVSVIDISNAAVYVRASDVGMKGTELTEINSNEDLLSRLECIRGMAAVKMGIVSDWREAATKCSAAPKIGILSPPQDYVDMDGNLVKAEDMDLCCRMISVGTMHKAYPMSYAVGTGSAALIEGTVVHSVVVPTHGAGHIILGHASGCTGVNVVMHGEEVVKAGILRTARRIMDGNLYIR